MKIFENILINNKNKIFINIQAGFEQMKDFRRLQSIFSHKPGIAGLLLTAMHLSFCKQNK